MNNYSIDLLKLQDSEQVKNTYYRSPKVSPNIKKLSSDCLVVNTVDDIVEIRRIDEVILYILADFKFLPYWLVQQWTEDVLGSKSIATEKVENWIKVGLVWIDTAPTGVYLRPTKFLLDMFIDDVEHSAYIDIPFNNQINHTISEEQLMFDIQIGNPKSEMWQIIKDEQTLNSYHPLLKDLNGSQAGESGTIILREALFRKGTTYRRTDEWLEGEQLIRDQIKAGKQFTEEFNDFTLFNIVTFNQSQNEAKDETYKQYPDLIVPIPRKNGIARSYAIEIELSAKTAEKYDYIMQSYKNNIKFGKLFYLCGSQRISKLVKEAFERSEGLGTCELYLLPFTPPSMRLESFTVEDEKNQINLFATSNQLSQ